MSEEEKAERRVLAATREARRQQVLETWGEIMLDPNQPAMARMACGVSIRDDDWGKPVQTTVNENRNRDLTAEEAEAKRIDVEAMLKGWKPPEK